MKIERNEPCLCGSGKKNKTCCKNDHIDSPKFDELSRRAAQLTLNQNEKQLLQGISKLEQYVSYSNIEISTKLELTINLIGAYHRRGLHKKALEKLDMIQLLVQPDDIFSKIIIAIYYGTSYFALQQYQSAVSKVDSIIEILLQKSEDGDRIGYFLLEAGKIYMAGERIEDATTVLEKCIHLFQTVPNEQETLQKARANLALIMMRSSDATIVKKGLDALRDSIKNKTESGDLVGLSIDYSNLGRFFHSSRNYKSALAYYRKDLWLSRQIGDLHAVDISLRNLINIYSELKQFKAAKGLLQESQTIAATLQDELIAQMANSHLEYIRTLEKSAWEQRQLTGPAAPCGCGVGKSYQECCGITDQEPVDLLFRFAGDSDFLLGEHYKFKKRESRINKLDFIFKESESSSRRRSWNTVEMGEGWQEMYELPDMANQYMIAAKSLLKDIENDPDEKNSPLTCLIMSVCALEAFINQVAYFFYEEKNNNDHFRYLHSGDFDGNAHDFQKNKELTNKWRLLGNALCEKNWNPSNELWTYFKNIIFIRNEFIHFKLSEYERVIPVPKQPHAIFNKLPPFIKPREVYHSWPTRILTPDFAKWSVDTAEAMIHYFKQQYNLSHPGNS